MIYETFKTKVATIKLHPEPLQASIVIGFDVPERKRVAARELLEIAAGLAHNVIQSALAERMAALGITIEDLRVDWD